MITLAFFIVAFLLGAVLIERQRFLRSLQRPANPALRAFTIRNLFLS